MNERFSTHSLVDMLAIQTGMDKARAEKFMDVLSAYIAQGIENNHSVKVTGLGVFKIVPVRERESVHIQTGERFVIPAHHKLSFIPDKELKDQINRPFDLFEPVETTGDPLFPGAAPADEPESPAVIPDDELTKGLSEETASGKTPAARPERTYPVDDYFIMEETDEEDDDEAYPLEEVHEDIDPIGAETVDQPDHIRSEYEKVDTYSGEYGQDQFHTGERSRFETEDADDDVLPEVGKYDGSLKKEKEKKKKSYSWVLYFLLLSFLFVAGVVVGTYAFLFYNSKKSYEKDVVALISNKQTNSALTTVPLPVGVLHATDTDGLDNPHKEDAASMPPEADSAKTAPVSADRAVVYKQPVAETQHTAAKEKREGKPVIDWLAPLPENNTRQETRRADKPNRAIEEKNKSLPYKTASATNQLKNAPSEKFIPPRVRMTAGSSLTQIALEHYNDKVFWVYIYDYNKQRITDFNNIPVGMEIRLPEPNIYGINAKNETSVQKARQKQSELLKWDKWDDYQ